MAKTISDRLAKRKCTEWLEKNGFTDVKLAKNESCDLIGRKNGEIYFIEVKYSSKEGGKFLGTVMLTELFQAVNNKKNYLFLVCRGISENIDEWFFKLLNVRNFMKCCALTTPIFLYHLYPDKYDDLSIPRFKESTALASEKLIREMWKDFKRWKLKDQKS